MGTAKVEKERHTDNSGVSQAYLWEVEPRQILKQHWGYDAFRPLQEDIIRAALSGRDVLALLPTGGGKSICYQVPGLALGGTTLVISPLIALMKDQVDQLRRRNISATFINSSLGRWEIEQRIARAIRGDLQFLYVAPERLQAEIFRNELPRMNIRLVAVDEAHCVSQWGHDFRPPYLTIPEMFQYMPRVPVMALTATATTPVQQDIRSFLELRDPAFFVKSFRRQNLRYEVREVEQLRPSLSALLRQCSGTGIVYTRTRRQVQELAGFLQTEGFVAEGYHGGLSAQDRNDIQQRWMTGATPVIVSTNAFGMGIDKPDVRWVIHAALPADLESYYQEAGRAGRDEQPSRAIALVRKADHAELQRWVQQKFPPFETVHTHYEALVTHFKVPRSGTPERWTIEADLGELSAWTRVHPLELYGSLSLLDREGILSFQETPEDRAYVRFIAAATYIREAGERNPEIATVTEAILRNFGAAVYGEMQAFYPFLLGKQHHISLESLDRTLKLMEELRLVRYQPSSRKPRLQLIVPAPKLTPVMLHWERQDMLRERAEQRLSQLLAYATRHDLCRSLFLQRYFGESASEPCGSCDVCERQTISPSEQRKRWMAMLRKTLPAAGMPLKNVLALLPAGRESESFLYELRASGYLALGSDGILTPGKRWPEQES